MARFGFLALALVLCQRVAHGLVISEINYHPPQGDDSLEFIELSADSAMPEDLSGYAFVEGIFFEFPQGTILEGRGTLVVCADRAALTALHPIQNALGNFSGRLDNSGERLTLVNHAGIVVQSIRYRDGGKWPVGPDGTGHTLALLNVHLDPGEPESWSPSTRLGGSPGKPNFPQETEEVVERALVDRGASWRYLKGTAPFSSPPGAWLQPAFDDGAWLAGASGFGFGDNDDATLLADMQGGYTSLACRIRFPLAAADLSGDGDIYLGVDFDDGFCAYLNGVEVARVNCGSPGETPLWDGVASASREAGAEVLFKVPRALLAVGENVLAAAGYNLSVSSTDFSLIPRLVHRRTSSQSSQIVETVILARGDAWRYRKGETPFSAPVPAWRQPGFNDSAWLEGFSGFGYRLDGGTAIAYGVPPGTVGNQEFGGALGMDFDVLRDIEVSRLGVFDSGSDGLILSITARLHDRADQSVLATITFTPGSPGTLLEGSRFKDLPAPLTLAAGFQGTISAVGYGAGEPNGNQGTNPMGLATSDGGGAIAFVGGGRFGDPATPSSYPASVDGGPADRYAAGTFEFREAGAPAGEVRAPSGVLTILADMPGRYTSLACRASFSLTEEELAETGEYYLGVDFEDGLCAFLNGAEIVRVNCGGPGEEPLAAGVASSARVGEGEQLFTIPRDLLQAGENLLALVGYSVGIDDPEMRLVPRLIRRRVVTAPGAHSPVVLNELLRGGPGGPGWVELHNAGPGPVDLSGFRLTAEPELPEHLLFPAGTVLEPGSFLVIAGHAAALPLSGEKVQLFLLDPAGLAVSAATFDRLAPPGAPPGAWSEARFPDGGPLDWMTLTPTPGQANRVDPVTSIVLNEIFYHAPEDRPDEFLELYNRGTSAVDLSGFSFDQGITYTIPAGTVLAPGEYLAVSNDPARLARNSGAASLGPYQGVLSDRGESVRLVDRLGNPVSRVRYFEGGQWSQWADGGGSSLELVDPDQDLASPSAWEASDESGKAAWERLAFNVPSYVPAAASELHLYLVERGSCLIDDVSIRRGGGANLIPNSGFETTTAPWIIEGTHVGSMRTTAESHSGAAALEVVATGKGDTLVNRIEIETAPALTAGSYEVSLWARWLRGSSLMVAHGEYSAGPYRVAPCFTCGVAAPNLSGNPLSSALRMTVPLDLGTPGEENSSTIRLRAETGSRNLGPVIGEVLHRPPSPPDGAPVLVTARVSDSQGVASVQAFYRVGSAAGVFNAVSLLDDGSSGEGRAGDGAYGGQLPGFPLLTRVVFYIEATDTRGAVRRFPPEAPGKTCLYLVQGGAPDTFDRYNLVLDTQRTAELGTRQLHSNDLLSGTFFFDNEKVYYDVGVRYRGSPWGRPSRQSYRVRFPEDALFHRGRRDLNLAKTGTSPNEGASHFLIARNAAPGRPSPATEYSWVRTWLNGNALGTKGLVEVIDGDFVDRWYGEGSQGPLLKAFGRFVFNDSGGLTGQQGWEGASLQYRGTNPENYRGYYVHSMDQSEDRWEPFIALTRLLDPVQTSNEALDRDVASLVDLESFLRVHSVRVLMGDGDAFGVNNGHNGYMVFNSLKGLWGILAFDTEAAFWNGAPDLFGSADPAMVRLLSRPEPRRAYLRILSEYTDGYWSAAKPKPYFDAVQKATGFATGSVLGFIGGSAPRVKAAVQPFLTVRLRILTNGGNEISTPAPSVDIEGEAPVSIHSLQLQRSTDEPLPLAPAWTTPTRWRTRVDLLPGRNELTFLGFDGGGNLLGSVPLAVTYRPAGFLRGDASGDLRIDISDPITVLFHLFAGLSVPCADGADFDDGGEIGLGDAIGSLEFLFRQGPQPAQPYPAPGSDVRDDLLPACGAGG